MLERIRQIDRHAVTCPNCNQEAGWHSPFAWLYREEKDEALRLGLTGISRNNGLVVTLFPGVFDWKDSDNPYRRGRGWGRALGNGWGVLRCTHCLKTVKHDLDWPSDAFYQISINGRVLWARDREELVRFRKQVVALSRSAASASDIYSYGHRGRLPSHFYSVRNRGKTIKEISKVLSAS